MSKVIICANQKGGVAKSTSVVNIGIGLARLGKKVLVIDNDPQGSLTEALGYPQPDKIENTLATIMEWVLNEEEFDLDAGILHHEEGIDLMPANIELSGVETSLIGIMSSETVLREYVEMIRDKYDYILIDCSPNLGQLTLNALVAADEVIIPVQAAYLPIKGLEQLLKTISRVKRKMNPSLNIMGILITMVDYRTVYANEITEILYQHYGKLKREHDKSPQRQFVKSPYIRKQGMPRISGCGCLECDKPQRLSKTSSQRLHYRQISHNLKFVVPANLLWRRFQVVGGSSG